MITCDNTWSNYKISLPGGLREGPGSDPNGWLWGLWRPGSKPRWPAAKPKVNMEVMCTNGTTTSGKCEKWWVMSCFLCLEDPWHVLNCQNYIRIINNLELLWISHVNSWDIIIRFNVLRKFLTGCNKSQVLRESLACPASRNWRFCAALSVNVSSELPSVEAFWSSALAHSLPSASTNLWDQIPIPSECKRCLFESFKILPVWTILSFLLNSHI